ncbi:MAG: sugar phosphate isomerase/epimerase [Ruminococcaceae bacterium]|nr:sugar phosphate isomerase/epimerase [Oscillospiraceae bacterium]
MSNLKIGLQLYSVRDKMEKDVDATLKAVKEMGYDYVEFAGYFDKTAQELADILKKYDLKCISVHQALDFYIEKGTAGIEYVKALGAEYSAIPWYDAAKYQEDFNGTMELFTKLGKQLKDGGLKMLYHNHDFEFKNIGDELIINKMYSTVPSEYLNPEFDTCWIKYAGYEPVEYLDTYKGRINVVHIKDFWAKKLANGPVYALIDADGNEIKNDSNAGRDFEFRPVGSGIQDVKAIMEASEKAGAEYVIVEQDNWYDDDSLECAKKSREYLKSIGY